MNDKKISLSKIYIYNPFQMKLRSPKDSASFEKVIRMNVPQILMHENWLYGHHTNQSFSLALDNKNYEQSIQLYNLFDLLIMHLHSLLNAFSYLKPIQILFSDLVLYHVIHFFDINYLKQNGEIFNTREQFIHQITLYLVFFLFVIWFLYCHSSFVGFF